ncbi:MAG: glycosyltransferase family 4 protein [Cyanobacteria bacterium P01_A01_bin.45]
MSTKSHLNRLHLWIPNLFEFKGGIQVFSEFLLQGLQSAYPNIKYDIFVKHDTQLPGNYQYTSQTQFHFFGKWGHKLRTIAFAFGLIIHGFLQRPDLIVTSHLNFTVAAYWLKKITGIPYWTVAHGIEAWDIKQPSLQKALHDANKILAVSSYTRDRLIKEQNLDPSKLVILPNTFDTNRFQVSLKPKYLLERYGLRAEQPVILTVARLDENEIYKGYDQVLRAIPYIRDTIPDIHYIIAGKGKDRVRVEELITQLKLEDYVTLAGFVPDEELGDYYNLCNVFAMPSKKEGFGIVYLEALASGKPVLAGNQDGAVDAVCNGELGVLVNPDDIESIADSLVQILKGTYPNPLFYQPLALRQKVIDKFSVEAFQKTLATYLTQDFQEDFQDIQIQNTKGG